MLNEKSFLQSIWRRAYAEPAGLSITYTSKNDAIRMRLKLYRAVREVKATPFNDPLLYESATDCEITIHEREDGRSVLTIARSMNNPLLQQAMAQLGMPAEATSPPPTLDEDESLRRLQARLDDQHDQ